MRYSRTGIIIALVGAEIFIAGVILATVRGNANWAWASGMHSASFTAKALEPVDAGSSPHVQIDDSDSSVTVTASTDGRIHVTDETQAGGSAFSRGQIAQLQIERTADGVRIVRPSHVEFFMIGWSDRRISVAVPAGAFLDITACSGADVRGLAGQVRVHSDDGRVSADGLSGGAELSTDDGHIDVQRIRGDNLTISSSDGGLSLNDVQVATIQASTDDGSISGSGLSIGGGSFKTSDGGIELALLGGNLSVRAHTDDGHVTFDGPASTLRQDDDNDGGSGEVRLGTGAGLLQVASQDGSIHITTNGAQ